MDDTLLTRVREICSKPFAGSKRSTPDPALMSAAFEELEALGPGGLEAVAHLLVMRELQEILKGAGERAIRYLHYTIEKRRLGKQSAVEYEEEAAAVTVLGAIGASAFSELQQVLWHHDVVEIRQAAAYQLAINGQIDVLASALTEDEDNVRIAAISGLHGLASVRRFSANETSSSELPIDLLLRSLKDSCPKVRRIGLSALADIDHVDIGIVTKALQDESGEVRRMGLQMLFDIGIDQDTAPLLANMLEDTDGEIVSSALKELGAKRFEQKVNPQATAAAIIDILVLRSSGRPADSFNSQVVASALEQTVKLQPPLQGKVLMQLCELAYTSDSGVRTRSIRVGRKLNAEDFTILAQEKAAENPKVAQPVLRLLGLGPDTALKQTVEPLSTTTMPTREALLKQIVGKLALWQRQIDLSGSINLYDSHIIAQYQVRRLLNMAYGYHLEDLDEATRNQVAIDLGDDNNGVAFQVTATTARKKLVETVEKFISSELYKRFQTLRFFILSEKQRSYKPIDTQGLFKFDVQTDILDFRDLIEAIKRLDTEPLSNVARFLVQEFPNPNLPAQPTQITELPCLNGDTCVLAGERLRVIREDIGLKPSEFITLVGLPSERQYQLIESNQQECSLSLLKRVQETTGAALTWLQHGTPPRYPVSSLRWTSGKDAARQIAEASPQQVYATIETTGLHIGLCVQVADQYYLVHELNLALDFWNWMEDFHYIPRLYEFLLELESRLEIQGVRLSQKTDRSLYAGKIHASHALRQGSSKYTNWVTAVLDLDCPPHRASAYMRRYGAWFKKVQGEFRKYRE